MTVSTTLRPARQTVDDLFRVKDKAELIGGRIIIQMPTGYLPSAVAGEIFVSLRAYAKASGRGVALGDGIGYVIGELASGRESFSPDVSYFAGPLPANPMRFINGAPTLAVEVRSETDYGPRAELELAAERADYFLAGTSVVWDVDPQKQAVLVYRASAPTTPTTYLRTDMADAEPGVPGWKMPVNEIFPK
ncbi:MAG TPA: Uma2 family endonuclease [Tepidisphaeraceae bacterium]|nr:Uma2 family endonuclease [Tepidisphaeraceae bacterium]